MNLPFWILNISLIKGMSANIKNFLETTEIADRIIGPFFKFSKSQV